jgi:hypothetical protein
LGRPDDAARRDIGRDQDRRHAHPKRQNSNPAG